MDAQDGQTREPRSPRDDKFPEHRIQPEPPVFEKVSDRDLVTLADVFCRSLEYYSMLVASRVIREVGARELWPAVIDRRAHSIRLSTPNADDQAAHRLAAAQIDHFLDEHFPVEPEQVGEDPAGDASRWNGYIAF